MKAHINRRGSISIGGDEVNTQESAALAGVLDRLRRALATLGDKAPERAHRFGVSPQQLHKLEKKSPLPDTVTLVKACLRTGWNGHWFLTGRGDERALDVGADEIFARGV